MHLGRNRWMCLGPCWWEKLRAPLIPHYLHERTLKKTKLARHVLRNIKVVVENESCSRGKGGKWKRRVSRPGSQGGRGTQDPGEDGPAHCAVLRSSERLGKCDFRKCLVFTSSCSLVLCCSFIWQHHIGGIWGE